MSVSTVPKTRNNSTEANPCPDHFVMNSKTWGVSLRFGTAPFIRDRPRNKRQKPMINSLIFRSLSFLDILRMTPTVIRGTASAEISALNPKMEIIQAVMVVPMLAPIITPIACDKVNNPALTKPTTITVVALDDWMTAVTPRPVRTPLKGFDVIFPRSRRRPFPADF